MASSGPPPHRWAFIEISQVGTRLVEGLNVGRQFIHERYYGASEVECTMG